MHELTRPDPLNALAGGPPEPVVKPLAPTLSVHDLAGGPPRGREHELADSDIDWIHMPMDTVTGWNKGHCFINMRSALKVFDLYRKLDGRKWVTHPAKKRCKVSYARVQCGTPEYEFVLRGAVAESQTFIEAQIARENEPPDAEQYYLQLQRAIQAADAAAARPPGAGPAPPPPPAYLGQHLGPVESICGSHRIT